MTPTEQKAFNLMREALEVLNNLDADINFLNTNELEDMMDKALTAAASVSHAKPETAPPPEGGAITSESVLALLVKEMRYIATITNGQAHRIAMMTLEKVAAANAVSAEPKGLFVDLIASHGPDFVAEMAGVSLTNEGDMPQAQGEALELHGIEEAIAEGQGFWAPCTGCFETNEGHPPRGSFFSKVFKCHLGNGCRECGGIGAIWDNTDYDAMAEFMIKEDANPQATKPAGYKLVPVEPTQEMLDAVVTTLDDHLLGPDAEKQYREDWAAMLAAAPEAKQ